MNTVAVILFINDEGIFRNPLTLHAAVYILFQTLRGEYSWIKCFNFQLMKARISFIGG
jgi:hypothetical protein